jgi:hypothetical protein
MQYTPSPTALRFMASRKFVKLICGPVGGGKSTAALQTLWTLACMQAPHGVNRVRRTKYAVLRNTSAMLKATVKPLIDYWFVTRLVEAGMPALGTWRVTDATFEIKARLTDGTIVHTEFVLVHADTPDDVRRLLSAEYSGAWVEEAREVDGVVFEGLQGRCDRFPNVEAGGVTYPCVICSTNPPPIGTYWHDKMVNPPPNMEVFMQPAALLEDGQLNPEAENLENLSPTYYANLVEGKTEDWINVYLRNKFGAGGLGQPVFRATWRSEFHTTKSALKPIPVGMKRIIVGSDNGLTAAAAIAQEDARGRVNFLSEAYVPEGESMGYDRFLEILLLPRLRELNVPNDFVLFVVDPACFHRSEANAVTIAQVIAKRGFQVVPASTSSIERRISAVEGLLMQQIDGGPRMAVSPTCTHIVNAMEWGYRNRKTAGASGTATPEKNHYSHIADAVQCVALYYNGGADLEQSRSTKARQVVPHQFAYT